MFRENLFLAMNETANAYNSDSFMFLIPILHAFSCVFVFFFVYMCSVFRSVPKPLHFVSVMSKERFSRIMRFYLRYYIHRRWQVLKEMGIPHDPPSISEVGNLKSVFANAEEVSKLIKL